VKPEYFFDFINSPDEAVYRISRTDTGYAGFLILILAVVSLTAGISLIGNAPSFIISFLLTWGMLVLFLFIFICASFYHYFAGIFGGEGKGAMLFKALPYSFFPFCFVSPLALILGMIGGNWGAFFLFLLLLLFICLTVYLQIKIISYIYGVSVRNSVAIFVLPWVIVGSLVFLIPVISGMAVLVSLR
jgi:hypothetical protein